MRVIMIVKTLPHMQNTYFIANFKHWCVYSESSNIIFTEICYKFIYYVYFSASCLTLYIKYIYNHRALLHVYIDYILYKGIHFITQALKYR